MSIIHLDKIEFLKRVANYEINPSGWEYLGDKPAIIDFYADWCAPCKAMTPILEELADEYNGKIYIYKVNVDEEMELATLFGIRSVPSLMFIPMDGKPQMGQGVAPKSELQKAIHEVLLS